MVFGVVVILAVSVLVINYFRGLPTNNVLQPNTTQKTQAKIHTVTIQDTLWSIAQSYYQDGFRWVDIAEANELTNPNIIEVGQELVLPGLESKSSGNSSETSSQSALADASHTVQKGETLWSIAVANYADGDEWVKIAQKNKLANPDLIHRGNELSLPQI